MKSLAETIDEARRAVEERMARQRQVQDHEAEARLLRSWRQEELAPIVNQVPTHCRGSRAELVARMDDKYFRIVDRWRWGDENLVLVGETGAGKTTAVAYLLRRLCREAVIHGNPKDEREPQILDLCRLIRWQPCEELSAIATEHGFGKGPPETVTRCQNARLLILDDLRVSHHAVAIDRILQVRYDREWPTITTTGLSERDLLVTFGEAVVRRLIDCGGKTGRVIRGAKKPTKTEERKSK